MKKIAFFFSFASLIMIFGSCKSDQTSQSDFDISIRMNNLPQKLNPLVGTPTTESTEINALIFLPLADYDPITYEMSPLLIKELSQGQKINEGPFAGGIKYEYEILPDAVWDDGTQITAEDYMFTIKIAKNPNVDASAWRGILKDISEVTIDENNPKKFTVTIGKYFHLAREVSCTFEILPKHIYDPNGVLDGYDLSLLNDVEKLDEFMKVDSTLAKFAQSFNSKDFTQDIVSGSGPYAIKSWEADQYIVLQKKANYWGNKYKDRTQLLNNPTTITYRGVKDENAALTLLKDGSIDLMNVKDATSFDNLKSIPGFDSLFALKTSPLLRYYYVSLNNRIPELEDKDVRKAIAYLFDVENIIETLENGYAERQIGAIMPNSPFYDSSLKPIPFDPKKAIEILESEGWKDSNGNGIRDKMVNNKLVEMEIDYLASTSPLGQKVGLLFQDNAKQAGVKVVLNIQEGAQLSASMSNHEFESAASAAGLSLAPYDPYQRWHSANSSVGGGNFFGYVNEANDSLIQKIRETEDFDERKKAYFEFQELMYDEQPVVFLYSPVQKFVLSKKYVGLFSVKRPGYYIGAFNLND